MRVAVVGATGTIGAPVAELLARNRYEVVRVSRRLEPGVDLDDPVSIYAFYDSVGELEAAAAAAQAPAQ